MEDVSKSEYLKVPLPASRPSDNPYSYVPTKTRIAIYDDMFSSPRIVDVLPQETRSYIGDIAAKTYEYAASAGGQIPYTVILEVVENFIHASFNESVVSILDSGNTIRFSDQGPGIEKKAQAQQPGFSSANSQMKEYIRGVGSGFPIIKNYMDVKHGNLLIEDNIGHGTVITITMGKRKMPEQSQLKSVKPRSSRTQKSAPPKVKISAQERSILLLCKEEGEIRLTDAVKKLNIPNSSTHNALNRLVKLELLEKNPSSPRLYRLTDDGARLCSSL